MFARKATSAGGRGDVNSDIGSRASREDRRVLAVEAREERDQVRGRPRGKGNRGVSRVRQHPLERRGRAVVQVGGVAFRPSNAGTSNPRAPARDFPQRILYWLDDRGALHARIEGKLRGKPASEEWAWTKAR
jgi:hypothetical protein